MEVTCRINVTDLEFDENWKSLRVGGCFFKYSSRSIDMAGKVFIRNMNLFVLQFHFLCFIFGFNLISGLPMAG